MASLFRPPESTRHNQKSPKLTLPSNLQRNHLDSTLSSSTSSSAPISHTNSNTHSNLHLNTPIKHNSNSSSTPVLSKISPRPLYSNKSYSINNTPPQLNLNKINNKTAPTTITSSTPRPPLPKLQNFANISSNPSPATSDSTLTPGDLTSKLHSSSNKNSSTTITPTLKTSSKSNVITSNTSTTNNTNANTNTNTNNNTTNTNSYSHSNNSSISHNHSLSNSSIGSNPFASSIGSNSSSSMKKRPVPPPLPPLVLTTSNTLHVSKSTATSPNKENIISLTGSLKNLNLSSKSNSPSNNIRNAITTTNMNIINKSNDSNISNDSKIIDDDSNDSDYSIVVSPYEKELIDTYKLQTQPLHSPPPIPSNRNNIIPQKLHQQNEKVRNSNSSTNNITSTHHEIEDSSNLNGKDVDELDESMWHYNHLNNEIQKLGMLGEGAGGSVAKCKLKNGSKIFALKTINILNTDPEYQKQILRELQFNKSFKSDYIVRYYGMFADNQRTSIFIAMEYMGGGSLDGIYKHLLERGGRIGEKVLGKIAESVLRGLSYLHEKKVIHRDIKPQNILLNELGQVKLCDFGVSGEAVNSLATTFTGTSFYMAPERIQGQPYSVTCDVWSLGLTLLEVAEAKFPFGSENLKTNLAPIDLLMLILTFTPNLKEEPENHIVWSSSFRSFIDYCLKKDPSDRPSPRQMIRHPWIQGQMKKSVNMQKFIKKCWES
ncbi:hypothetical protein TBLA_0B03990 [Henningerozyma blattae CBS 6284]|uniref:mitogen-activated protein kinase kinase n=1 Tax=Henningerozyma blattae (strain ATCC 34711 / CBS 6284 / DSM 70876 / NBRC 10599 / NRRL Y-10934 / UCD 77-7) TaxID=1071380 RepID=I2GYN5_HENB6|nr:hypothetical protein TBLA_0B03990 [Tetrapisispora blattae CBS 6284]CCH59237.1 hypothetical protein TBLA_0B03990 [Tetrapisispora blattae CBS 6284]